MVVIYIPTYQDTSPLELIQSVHEKAELLCGLVYFGDRVRTTVFNLLSLGNFWQNITVPSQCEIFPWT